MTMMVRHLSRNFSYYDYSNSNFGNSPSAEIVGHYDHGNNKK